MVIAKESAPHLRRKASVTRMMVDVLIALAPTLIFSFVVFPIKTLIFYLISVVIMEGAEFVYVGPYELQSSHLVVEAVAPVELLSVEEA